MRRLLFDLLYLLSSDKSDSLDDESNGDGSDSGFSGTYSFSDFYLCLENSVGRISVLGSGVFVPIGVDSKCDFLGLTCLYQ